MDVTYARERFPGVTEMAQFAKLFIEHGIEVRGQPFELFLPRYHSVELENRLVWFVARSIQTEQPVGYSCAYWYRDLHFAEVVAADDIWYVDKEFRRKGIGRALRAMCHDVLQQAGVIRVYDALRAEYNHPTLMLDLGYKLWGARWVRDFTTIPVSPAGSGS